MKWDIKLSDGRNHTLVFNHNTLSGRRTIVFDGKTLRTTGWMFKLVGTESVELTTPSGRTHAATVTIEPSGLNYKYTLTIDGTDTESFEQRQRIISKTWVFDLDGVSHSVVLEKDSMDIWLDGDRVEAAGEFVDDGTETHFSIGSHACYVLTTSTGTKHGRMAHELYVDDLEISPATDDRTR